MREANVIAEPERHASGFLQCYRTRTRSSVLNVAAQRSELHPRDRRDHEEQDDRLS